MLSSHPETPVDCKLVLKCTFHQGEVLKKKKAAPPTTMMLHYHENESVAVLGRVKRHRPVHKLNEARLRSLLLKMHISNRGQSRQSHNAGRAVPHYLYTKAAPLIKQLHVLSPRIKLGMHVPFQKRDAYTMPSILSQLSNRRKGDAHNNLV